MTTGTVEPDDVPDELIEVARQAWTSAPQKRDGKPTRMRHAAAAILSFLAQQDAAAEPVAEAAPSPRVTLRTNTPAVGVHQVLVDGHDISRACRRARLLLDPGCWPRLDLELKIIESGGVDAAGAEVVLPPETMLALEALGWTPPGPPARPDSARS